jgi:AbiV family abortive infection protein
LTNREILRGKMQEGIDLCKKNAMDFLNDAKLIVAEKRLNHAYVLVEFAIEEFGKAAILSNQLRSSTSDPIPIPEQIFKSHKGKAEKAWTILDRKFKTIYGHGGFDDVGFDYTGFQTDTKARHETRLHCAFVDCEYGNWYLGRNIDVNLLNDLITHIEARLSRI